MLSVNGSNHVWVFGLEGFCRNYSDLLLSHKLTHRHMCMNGHGWVPIKLYLHKWAEGWFQLEGQSWLIPDLKQWFTNLSVNQISLQTS